METQGNDTSGRAALRQVVPFLPNDNRHNPLERKEADRREQLLRHRRVVDVAAEVESCLICMEEALDQVQHELDAIGQTADHTLRRRLTCIWRLLNGVYMEQRLAVEATDLLCSRSPETAYLHRDGPAHSAGLPSTSRKPNSWTPPKTLACSALM